VGWLIWLSRQVQLFIQAFATIRPAWVEAHVGGYWYVVSEYIHWKSENHSISQINTHWSRHKIDVGDITVADGATKNITLTLLGGDNEIILGEIPGNGSTWPEGGFTTGVSGIQMAVSSANTSIATVSFPGTDTTDANGEVVFEVTGVNVGSTTVTITGNTTLGGSCKNQANVTVTSP